MTRDTVLQLVTDNFGSGTSITAAELRTVTNGVIGEVNLRTEYCIFNTRADMLAAAWLETGQYVRTLGYAAAGDGGGAEWVILASGTADKYVTVDLSESGTRRARMLSKPGDVWDMRCVGVFTATSGTDVKDACLAVWNHLRNVVGGGEMYFHENFTCNNTTFPRATPDSLIRIRFRQWVSMRPGNPVEGTYVWYFQDGAADGANLGIELIHVMISGDNIPDEGDQDLDRPTCNGIRVGAGNQLQTLGLRSQRIRGTAWRFDMPYNAHIDVTTYRSGKSVSGLPSVPAMLICGSATMGSTAGGDNANDYILKGATEGDFYGWRLEGSVLVRCEEPIKVHGEGWSTTSLDIHRCNDFVIKIHGSQDYLGDFVRVTDAGNTLGVTEIQPFTRMPTTTRGLLEITTIHNREYVGTGTGYWLTVGLNTATSQLGISGYLKAQVPSTTGTGTDIRIMATTANVRIDMEDLKFQDDPYANGLVTDLRTEANQENRRFFRLGNRPGVPTFTEADVSAGVLDVTGYDIVIFAPTVATSISSLTMRVGEKCTVVCSTANATFTNGSGQRLAGAANWAAPQYGTITIVRTTATASFEASRGT